MQLDIKKAYQYYVDNINRSCNTNILDEQSFHKVFPAFLQDLQIMSVMNSDMENIPIYNDKCGTSRIVNIDVVIKKCI